jgi:hypothetical protein
MVHFSNMAEFSNSCGSCGSLLPTKYKKKECENCGLPVNPVRNVSKSQVRPQQLRTEMQNELTRLETDMATSPTDDSLIRQYMDEWEINSTLLRVVAPFNPETRQRPSGSDQMLEMMNSFEYHFILDNTEFKKKFTFTDPQDFGNFINQFAKRQEINGGPKILVVDQSGVKTTFKPYGELRKPGGGKIFRIIFLIFILIVIFL